MMGNAMTVTGFHKDYGLPDDFRARVVKYAADTSVKEAIEKFNVSQISIWRWRKAFEAALGQ